MMASILDRPNPSEEVSSLVQQIQQASNDLYTPNEVINEESRKLTLALAKKLATALEKPEDVLMRYAVEQATHCTCLRLGIDLRIFHILVEHEGVSVSASQLAELSKAELLLIVRIMRIITSIGFAVELDEQIYRATSLTRAITHPAVEAGVKFSYDMFPSTQLGMVEHFRKHGYKSPTDSRNCPFHWTYATDLSFFEYLQENPEKQRDYNNFATEARAARKHWVDWFPVESQIFSATDPGDENDTLLVDVGGGKGQDLERFLGHYPQTNGRLVLQDLPSTISTLQQLSSGIRPMPHDFFTPQPVKGARAYYTHSILHCWPDAECRLILQNLVTAMKAGYSKILLNEAVIPKRNCSSWFAAADIITMSCFAGIERTENQWIDLLQSVGLEVVKIWNSPYVDEEAIIEAMLKS